MRQTRILIVPHTLGSRVMASLCLHYPGVLSWPVWSETRGGEYLTKQRAQDCP